MNRKLVEKKREEAGWGSWFRNSDNVQVFVDVRFYPRLRLYLHEGQFPKPRTKGTPITREELERNYHRLRV